MKLILFLLLPFALQSQTCPPQGDNAKLKIQAADLLKNRSYFPDTSTANFIEFDSLETTKDTGLIYIDDAIRCP